ncbi:MAG TPA: macro domain-containing protein [Spirochaetota bacterium]|nr:macro domain-containing protein [Spirochaetota bacterium]HPR48831.1 macro domain-containing protein [Spirochaetota bacterium]
MIQIVKGNIVDQPTEAIVNTVNCVGVMGRGIALSFKKAFPENYHEYKEACDRGEVVPGKMFVYITGDIFERKYIINFPTKRHWKGESRLEDIKAGLFDLIKTVKEYNIKSITVPPLGCGLGGLDWKVVRPLIEKAFEELSDVSVHIIEPNESYEIKKESDKPLGKKKLTPGRASLLVLMGRYLEAMMDTSVTLLELHKLMYFLQEAGEPLRLKYKKALYGPYAENFRHVLDVMNNSYISGFDDREDNPDKEINLINGSYAEAVDFLKDKLDTLKNIDKVSTLIAGFETPFGMELLSTVHWVVAKENGTDDNIVELTHSWNKRKEMFTNKQIFAAQLQLKDNNWI